MKREKKHQPQLRQTGERARFAASNSERGFYSYYKEYFNEADLDGLWIIKGGPGTGKSRLMREVCDEGERRGWQSETVYCSSDPDSLDGVILRRGDAAIALLDGTAPHVWEPKTAGVTGHVIDLGAFWDVGRLRENGEEIRLLSEEKSRAYRRAYRFLSAYGEVSRNQREAMEPYLRRDAIRRFARRLIRPLGNGEAFAPRNALMHGVGMKGEVWFDTWFSEAEQILLIEDCKGGGDLLMEELYRLCAEQRLTVEVSHDPILPDRVEGLYLPDSRCTFSLCPSELCPYPHRKISTRRFVSVKEMGEARQSHRQGELLRQALLDEALRELDTARLIHFRLEEIYTATMDFSAKEAFTKQLCDKILGLQTR